MKRHEGKGGIWVEVVCDSRNVWNDRVTTFRLHYPRFIHSEFMTHRMVSKNASSSRAIPVHSMLETIAENPAMPIHWGLNQPGMQADKEGNILVESRNWDGGVSNVTAPAAWKDAANRACEAADAMWKDGKGYHKQIVNRLTEPFTYMNVVATATDWDNFFWLRYHKDAQPEIAELARLMYEAISESDPKLLFHGEYHMPYVTSFRDNEGLLQYCDDDGDSVYSLEEALMVSSSCCAQASYRKLDQSLEKAIDLFDRLVGGEPLHASPFEHPCMPYSTGEYEARVNAKEILVESLVEFDYSSSEAAKLADICMYTGNFRGFTQYRKTLKNENLNIPFEKV